MISQPLISSFIPQDFDWLVDALCHIQHYLIYLVKGTKNS